MITLRSAQQIANQIQKARQLKPLVKFIGPRQYKVQSETQPHLFHSVRFSFVNGERLAECDCTAGERGKACYHLAAAVPHHILKMAEARSAQAAA